MAGKESSGVRQVKAVKTKAVKTKAVKTKAVKTSAGKGDRGSGRHRPTALGAVLSRASTNAPPSVILRPAARILLRGGRPTVSHIDEGCISCSKSD